MFEYRALWRLTCVQSKTWECGSDPSGEMSRHHAQKWDEQLVHCREKHASKLGSMTTAFWHCSLGHRRMRMLFMISASTPSLLTMGVIDEACGANM